MKKHVLLISCLLLLSSCVLQKQKETTPKIPETEHMMSSEVEKNNTVNTTTESKQKPVEKAKTEVIKTDKPAQKDTSAEDVTKELEGMIDAIVGGK